MHFMRNSIRRMKNFKSPNKFSSALIVIALALGFFCGIAGCKTRSNRAWLRDSGGCSGKLSSDQEVGLVNAIVNSMRPFSAARFPVMSVTRKLGLP